MKKMRVFLVCVLILVFNLNCVFAANITYDDIQTHWAKDNIEYLSIHNIINGYEDNTFRPDINVSKAEIIKLVVSLIITGFLVCAA